jgi:hypothetical protein
VPGKEFKSNSPKEHCYAGKEIEGKQVGRASDSEQKAGARVADG